MIYLIWLPTTIPIFILQIAWEIMHLIWRQFSYWMTKRTKKKRWPITIFKPLEKILLVNGEGVKAFSFYRNCKIVKSKSFLPPLSAEKKNEKYSISFYEKWQITTLFQIFRSIYSVVNKNKSPKDKNLFLFWFILF